MGNGVRAPRPAATVPTSGVKPPSEAPGVRLASSAGGRAKDFWRMRTCHLPTKSSLPRHGSAGVHVPPTHQAPSSSEVRFGRCARAAYPLSAVLWEAIGRRASQNQRNDFVCRPAPSFLPKRQDARAEAPDPPLLIVLVTLLIIY